MLELIVSLLKRKKNKYIYIYIYIYMNIHNYVTKLELFK
jgi:hypothetical protein